MAAGHDVAIVITRPDRKRGRGGALTASPVKAAALELGLPVGHQLADLDGLGVERGVVVAYGALIPATLLERIPMLNVHFSLLPRWRGAAPVERAILAGDEVTGVSIMTLEPELDTGPVHLVRSVAIDDKTLHDLLVELGDAGARALIEVLDSPSLLAHPTAQRGEATYAKKITKETFHLQPSMSAATLLATVRLGRAFVLVDGRRVRVLRAHRGTDQGGEPGRIVRIDAQVCLTVADAHVVLEEVQPEGARVMSATSWWSGARLSADASWT